ncbi:cupredoxin domain-containing protein [Natrinema salaciae]|uniref:Copper binding protein, plastocyanin/azurin family n=1 Tax=Natrinema salaciae TaxID=1186196 RepID=A0A1H9ECM2_9EURY|nr:hypothetical protein [Natrinema salaciae]SEQ23347.1 hypothetical protein SAMN04489841_1254 [Natrinema salaciae]
MTGTKQTRRTALRLLGATAATIGLSSSGSAQENESADGVGDHDHSDHDHDDDHGGGNERTLGETDRQPIILAGRTAYWYGIAPEEIEGEENPTLNLADGQEYDLVWINVDGAEHELRVESEDGKDLEASDSSETAGEVVVLTFEASEDAAEYYCEYHPETMRGGVEFDGGFDLSPNGNGSDGGNETARESETETGDGETGY